MRKLFINPITAVFLLIISCCIKENFDSPPGSGKDPVIAVNFSIDSLKARFAGQNYYINEDLVVSGIVTADDKSGNFYKQIAVQDSTGGITLLLDGTGIYTDYPIGRRIFIKLKGLFVVSYKGLIQIAAGINPDGSFSGIPVALFGRYVLKGSYFHPVAAKALSLDELNDSYQSQLVALENVEFQSVDAGKPFADGYNKVSVSRTLQDCNGNSIVVYTSGYAAFANTLTPAGRGKMLALYSVYNGTGQLLIRNLSDIHLDSPRCVINTNTISISTLRAEYTGSPVTIPQGQLISGIVISDAGNGNIDPRGAIIQDSTGGISLFFSAAHGLALGDKVIVELSNQTLTPYNGGALEVSDVPLVNINKTGTGTIEPRTATISEIQANSKAWESTLLRITGVTISGNGSTYAGTKKLKDGTGTLDLYTRNGSSGSASFANTFYPTGPVSVTGFLGSYNSTPQLQMRNAGDVQ